MDTPLEAHGLAKRYGRGVWALQGVDLIIRSGLITALVGPNAAGKSTLIRSWVGFERPTRGTARVNGIDPWRDPGRALRHIGYVPQLPALHDDLSIEQHVALASHLRPGFDRPGTIRRLQQLGIPIQARGREVSGGQRAQVALSIALGTRAAALLLDEPLASLDPLARREFLALVRQAVVSEGTTVLLSSHVVSDVEQGCDRLIVLGVGRVLLDSSIPEALAAHAIAVDPSPNQADVVASFAGPTGDTLTLIRKGSDATLATRPATLEEVVIGHLSAGRAGAAQTTVPAA